MVRHAEKKGVNHTMAVELPSDLQDRLGTVTWHPVTIGCSDARTYRLQGDNEICTYLKIMNDGGRQSLQPEAERLSWLQGKLSVPAVLDYRIANNQEILWMTSVPGFHAANPIWTDKLQEMVESMARGLRAIHSLAISDCPFDHRNVSRVEEARLQLQNGWVDEEDFDSHRRDLSAVELFTQLEETMPANEDLVFTHGDYCLPNIVLDQKMKFGFIDWGRAGIADRYQDIALAVRSLRSNWGEKWGDVFLEAYGLAKPDWGKIAFYQLLDEFF